ncbi:hypothetical protein T06_12818 [Trichinella sp. T6]|nr:hypothetical protein T06_12818 [Trichinella sp. T6]
MQMRIAITLPYLMEQGKCENTSAKGRHAAERGRHKVKQQNTGGVCGFPSVPILLASAAENSNGSQTAWKNNTSSKGGGGDGGW